MTQGIPRFFAYLSLFTFSMLMLVTADNLVQMFFGWEGVGVCSYLLIGFWYQRESANEAAIKAFVVNRVGDFGFALGIFGVFAMFGSVEFATVLSGRCGRRGAQEDLPDRAATALPGRTRSTSSASFSSSVRWASRPSCCCTPGCRMPMEGPTPVSALIHAATMVRPPASSWSRACRRSVEYAPIALAGRHGVTRRVVTALLLARHQWGWCRTTLSGSDRLFDLLDSSATCSSPSRRLRLSGGDLPP